MDTEILCNCLMINLTGLLLDGHDLNGNGFAMFGSRLGFMRSMSSRSRIIVNMLYNLTLLNINIIVHNTKVC